MKDRSDDPLHHKQMFYQGPISHSAFWRKTTKYKPDSLNRQVQLVVLSNVKVSPWDSTKIQLPESEKFSLSK